MEQSKDKLDIIVSIYDVIFVLLNEEKLTLEINIKINGTK